MRKCEVRVNGTTAGQLEETEQGYLFCYFTTYLNQHSLPAVSLTLPKRIEPYHSSILFPFFAGLLAEGVAMKIQCSKLKIDEADLFGRLLKTAHDDVIGSVTLHETTEEQP